MEDGEARMVPQSGRFCTGVGKKWIISSGGRNSSSLFRGYTQIFKGAGTGPSHSLRLHRRIDSEKKEKLRSGEGFFPLFSVTYVFPREAPGWKLEQPMYR